MNVVASIARWRPSRRTSLLTGGAAALLLALLATVGLTSLAWGDTLREERRLLPGTTIASVDVGDHTVDEAAAVVSDHLDDRLDRVVEVTYDEQRWETTARELGASTDVEQVVERAYQRTVDAGLVELARLRWAGGSAGGALDVAVDVPEEELDGFVADIAEEVDRDARDAAATWVDGEVELSDARDGREVDVEATADALRHALHGDDDVVELPVDVTAPELSTEAAQEAVDALRPVIDDHLDHQVTVAHGGSTWSVTPRDLDAVPDVQGAVDAVAEGTEAGEVDLDLDVPPEALSGFVGSLAGEVDVAPRNAAVDWVDGGLEVTPERHGQAIDRDQAADDLRAALDGGSDRVELTVHPVQASITSASFDRVLVLRQGERRLYLYRDGEAVRDWPVAVGLAGSPTPTGTFTVGAKRYEPTWVNPSPNGWGSDMPERIGPGPDNPLGTRALNWNQGGRDTLIRFHGTPNEDSIGEAASQGCVRLYNEDVEELYDLAPSGTTIVSMS